MPPQRASGRQPARQRQVPERAALDADEESVELDEGAGEGDERPVPALRPGRASPVEVSLIDVAMVEPGNREPPAEAAVDGEPGS